MDTSELEMRYGWYFEVKEICNGGYQVTGSDSFGRLVTKQGHDPNVLLEECKQKAVEIQSQLIK